MAENTPDFLQNIGDDAESRDLLEALNGEPENEEPKDDTKTEDAVVEEVKEETPADPAVLDDKPADDPANPTPKDPVADDKGEGKDNKPPESDPKKPEEQPKVFGKYKDIEAAEKGYKELESSFGRVTAMLEGYKTGKIPANIPEGSADLLKMAETPMVKFAKPRVSDYTNADGIMDVDAYMSEFSKNLVVGIQKSLLMGPLAAAQFGILQQAMNEEHGSRIESQKSEAQAEEITNKLYDSFPVLKTNKELEETISNTILGAKLMRENQAKAKGEKMVPFTYEDYERIITSVIRNDGSAPTPQNQDKVEKMPAGPVLKGKTSNTNEMDDIISGMESVTKKGSLF